MATHPQRPVLQLTKVFLGALALALLSAVSVHAEPPGLATADVKQAGPDFPLVGEFVGSVVTDPSHPKPVALQIRATGGGTFDAIQFAGGLPNRPIDYSKAIRMDGKRTDKYAVLSGGPWIVLAHPERCVLIDSEGNRVGQLQRVVRTSPTMGAKPPEGAVVIFDGTNTDQFTKAEMTDDGLLTQGAIFKPMFQDFNLHLEFMTPYVPAGRDQGRGNSGVYLQSRYEVQVLDSFALAPVFNGCGGLYRFRAADVNMALPPLTWQTYDIIFTAPRWGSDGKKMRNARITVWQNGVKIHNDVELPNKTGAGRTEEPTLEPIQLQDHGNPVRYRNIWAIDRGLASAGRFPIFPEKKQPEKKEPEKKEPEKKQPAKQQPEKKEAPKQEPEKKEPVKKEPAKTQPEKQQPEQKQPEKKQPEKKEPEKQPSEKQSEQKQPEKPGPEKEQTEKKA